MLINTPSQNCHFFIGRHCTIQGDTEGRAGRQPAPYAHRTERTQFTERLFNKGPCPVPLVIIISVRKNEPAPDFVLPDLNGDLVRLSDLWGKIVILNFWSCEC